MHKLINYFMKAFKPALLNHTPFAKIISNDNSDFDEHELCLTQSYMCIREERKINVPYKVEPHNE